MTGEPRIAGSRFGALLKPRGAGGTSGGFRRHRRDGRAQNLVHAFYAAAIDETGKLTQCIFCVSVRRKLIYCEAEVFLGDGTEQHGAMARDPIAHAVAVGGAHDVLDGMSDHLQRNKIFLAAALFQIENQLAAAPQTRTGAA